MNNGALQQWIQSNLGIPGVLGFGIFTQNKESFVQSCTSTFSPQGLENAWRCVAETIPVLQLNRFPTARFRFVYHHAVVHCERRRDGTCLGIFAVKGHQFEQDELYRLLNEFHGL
jgi:hypothetical protein